MYDFLAPPPTPKLVLAVSSFFHLCIRSEQHHVTRLAFQQQKMAKTQKTSKYVWSSEAALASKTPATRHKRFSWVLHFLKTKKEENGRMLFAVGVFFCGDGGDGGGDRDGGGTDRERYLTDLVTERTDERKKKQQQQKGGSFFLFQISAGKRNLTKRLFPFFCNNVCAVLHKEREKDGGGKNSSSEDRDNDQKRRKNGN